MPEPRAEPHATRRLPPRPSLEHLKNEAKRRLQALRWLTPATKLAEVQHQVAREYGFANWRELKANVDRASGLPASPEDCAGLGDWIGLFAGGSRVALHITPGEDGLTVTMDMPDYGFFGLGADDVRLAGGRLSFTLLAPMPVGSSQSAYEARWDAAAERWIGEWTGHGVTLQLDFMRGAYPPAPSIAGLDGFWDGRLPSAKGPIRLSFRFKTDRHGTHAWLDSPDTNLIGRPAMRIERRDREVVVTMRTVAITGRLSADGQAIEGEFIKNGTARPLTLLRRPPGAAAPLPERPQAMEVAPEILERYAGLYMSALRTVLAVSVEDDRLFAQFTADGGKAVSGPKLDLVAASPTRFYWRVMDAALTFEQAPDGRVLAAVMHQNGRASRAERIG